jgi:phosphoribosylformylglycinamidine synthase
LELPKNRYLFNGVVSGIASYGNCIGVPTVGGEIYFNEIYSKNNLVNVFCLGIARKGNIIRGRADGIGNPIMYVGSKTGRDGIHGATMASESFGSQSNQKKPMVQIGDPFTEKLLLEACLDLIEKKLLVGIQDMGAAGLTSSSIEMAGRSDNGVRLDVSLVPKREEGMTPYEVMLSESQERMLLVVKSGKTKEVENILGKWDLEAVVIGEVIAEKRIYVMEGDRKVADIPIHGLIDDAPVLERPLAPPPFLDQLQALNLEVLKEPDDFNEILLKLIGSPSLASKRWVYEQYDHMVRTNTVVLPGGGASVIRVKGTQKGLALTVDGNSRYCLLNPYLGGQIIVAEAARNVVCVGARPLALTNCLNFGNPERLEVMWQFALAVEGISETARQFKIPVVSGNVSFYNETQGVGIYPTPVIGLVGLMEDVSLFTTPWFKNEGDLILLLGKTLEELGGTEYLHLVMHQEKGLPPSLNLSLEERVQRVCFKAIQNRLLSSAQDCSEGGLMVALAESCFLSPGHLLGAEINLEASGIRLDALLFGETQSRIIVSLSEKNLEPLKNLANSEGVPWQILGRVGGDRLTVYEKSRKKIPSPVISQRVNSLREIWEGAIPLLLDQGGASYV